MFEIFTKSHVGSILGSNDIKHYKNVNKISQLLPEKIDM